MDAAILPFEPEGSSVKPLIHGTKGVLKHSSPDRRIPWVGLLLLVFLVIWLKRLIGDLEASLPQLAQSQELSDETKQAMRAWAKELAKVAADGHQVADKADSLISGNGKGERLLHGALMRFFISRMRLVADRLEDISEVYALGTSERFQEFIREELSEFA